MSTENDVPLGEEARRYYEQQFGKRIQQIKKGGKAPQHNPSGSFNWFSPAGYGRIAAAAFLMHLIVTFVRTQSNTPTYPPLPVLPPPAFVNQEKPLAEQIQEVNAEAEAVLLRASDVPWPEGLCYRIYQESLRPDASPGKHLLKLFDPNARRLLIQSAQGQALDGNESQALLIGLNDVLEHADFWDEEAFQQPPPFAEILNKGRIAAQLQGFDDLLATRMKERRLLLEHCYPRQIVPLNERHRLDERARTEWVRRAQRDLHEAHRKYEPKDR